MSNSSRAPGIDSPPYTPYRYKMARNKTYRNMRVLLRPSDMQRLAELRDRLQRAEPGRAITDSEVVRKAIGIANGFVLDAPGEAMQRGRPPTVGKATGQ